MLNQNFVILGGLINLAGISRYVIDTVNGSTKPNRATWLLWAIIPFIAFSAELKQGVGLLSIMTLVIGVGPLIVFLSSFADRKSYWKLDNFDKACGVLAFLAIVAWLVTSNGDLAIVLSMLAHFLACVPTLIKAYKKPETESSVVYMTGVASTGITLLTIKYWDFASFGFPLYIMLISIVCIIVCERPRFKFLQTKYFRA